MKGDKQKTQRLFSGLLNLNREIDILVYTLDIPKTSPHIRVVCSRLKLGNACYYSVQNLLSCRLLSKNLKIKIYRTIILPVVLYGCKTWSLTLREERRLRVFENRVLRRVFGPKRDEATGEWRKLLA